MKTDLVTKLKRQTEKRKTIQDRMKIFEGLALGEVAFSQGRIVSHFDAKERMSKWLK